MAEHRSAPAGLSRPANCPDLECLAAVAASEGSPADAHIASCPYCLNEIAMLRSFLSESPGKGESAGVAWIAAELRRRPSPWQSLPRRSRWAGLREWVRTPSLGWAPAAAFASIVLLLGSGLYIGLRRPAPVSLDSVGAFRSLRVSTLAPAGDVSGAPDTLSWRAVEGAGGYRVRLLEVDGTVMWSAATSATEVALPQDVRARLVPGRAFDWQVVAESNGRPIAESNLQRFHIL